MLRAAAAFAHSMIELIIGTPMPATTRVVQIEPAPMPTFTASTPASIERLGRLGRGDVAGDEIGVRELAADAARPCRCTPCEWPCAVSMTSTSTPAATSACARSIESLAMPMAAPQRSRPSASLHAFGYLIPFWMSLTVIRPFSRKSLSTTRSFSTLCWCRNLARLVERRADRHREQRVLGHDLVDLRG